jgi:hypothetical protein
MDRAESSGFNKGHVGGTEAWIRNARAMNNSITSSPPPGPIKPAYPSGQQNGRQGTGADAGKQESQNPYGAQIAQTALQSVGLSTRNIAGPFTTNPEYAVAVSLIFTRATNQDIMLGTNPRHVLSTSILCNSLLHDKRFKQISMSEAAPGDFVIESSKNQAGAYAGILVDHGRIVSAGTTGAVQNNYSLPEIQRNRPATAIFRYIGVQNPPSYSLPNQGYNPDEPLPPAGQPGGGQWTTGGAGAGVKNGKEKMEMAPARPVVPGGNRWTGEGKPKSGDATGNNNAVASLTDAQRNLLRQKNAEAVAIIARYGGKGVRPETPESLLNGPLKTVWGSNAGWMPWTPKWDLRQRYKGFTDEDIALMESTRSNGVLALAALAQAGKLSKSQVTALQMRGMGVMAEGALDLALVLAPYESIAGVVSRGLLGTAEVTVGTGVREFASQPEEALKGSTPLASPYAETSGGISSYIASLPTRPAVGSGPSQAFQVANAGPTEYLVSGGKTQLWADGIDSTTILETKFVGNPGSSPFIPGSSIPERIRQKVLADVEDEFDRMKKFIDASGNPLLSVRIITNNPAANPYFRSLLDKYRLKGEIVNP